MTTCSASRNVLRGAGSIAMALAIAAGKAPDQAVAVERAAACCKNSRLFGMKTPTTFTARSRELVCSSRLRSGALPARVRRELDGGDLWQAAIRRKSQAAQS